MCGRKAKVQRTNAFLFKGKAQTKAPRAIAGLFFAVIPAQAGIQI